MPTPLARMRESGGAGEWDTFLAVAFPGDQTQILPYNRVIRRLKRVCRHYGSAPRFILASATIANPGELAERLTGVPNSTAA